MSDAIATEDSLCIFEDMEGFEGLNSSDDSTLIALLDLQEETLINLLSDDYFAKDPTDFSLGTNKRSKSDDKYSHTIPCTEDFLDARLLTSTLVNPSDFLVSKELLCESDQHSKFEIDDAGACRAKRARLDSLAYDGTVSTSGCNHALTCVMHDHCYAIVETPCQTSSSSTNSDEDASNEEGSNSDTGTYVAML